MRTVFRKGSSGFPSHISAALVERVYRFHNYSDLTCSRRYVQLFVMESRVESISTGNTDCENGQRADIER